MNGVSLLIYESQYYTLLYYNLVAQITGHGILTGLFMYFYAYIHRFCLYSKVSIIGLIALNIYNIVHNAFELTNYYIYASIIVFITIILSLIFIIREWKSLKN